MDCALTPCVHQAWEQWRRIGQPKHLVAPMVEGSELPFRMLCRKYGAAAAYSPMLHSRIFSENRTYRRKEFSTCPEDRPLFVQFCGNDPDTLLAAAQIVEPLCDYIDINLGCPQKIASRGNYGSFLMDNLPLVSLLVSKMASNLEVPVSCKIRVFPEVDKTVAYARMLEESGCALLAVHGRTREQKCSRTTKAEWGQIKAIKEAVQIPVLANGNIYHINDVTECVNETGADGVLSGNALLDNPAFFTGRSLAAPCQSGDYIVDTLDAPTLCLEYLGFCEKYPVEPRMVYAHVYRLLRHWFDVHEDLRKQLEQHRSFNLDALRSIIHEMLERDKMVLN